jgi:hypothetical protein
VAIVMLLTPVYTYEHHLVWAVPAFLVVGAAIASQRASRWWTGASAGAMLAVFLAWGAPPRLLKAINQSLSDAGATWLAFGVQEAKFIALVILAGLTIWLGSRTKDRGATPESS